MLEAGTEMQQSFLRVTECTYTNDVICKHAGVVRLYRILNKLSIVSLSSIINLTHPLIEQWRTLIIESVVVTLFNLIFLC